ncbi:uncharacterized protein LOC106472897 isoform X2 [Limulus polyphemus]|uniref:Uncharacterized protein LOC106472897 isoform X2 n=1 Tax=Limulus polyphemus TaxID=6850 RepID=A0ABM1TQ85_LIMPO|nr:uncharacterized protein LOC106472897 isoform X2 [Limulus polyphemus]
MKSHFHVRLAGGSPWGFRIQGGRQARQPVRISSLTRGGKAALGGIREGDVLDAINGKTVVSLTQTEAHQLIQATGDTLNLTLRREENFPAKGMFKSSTTIEVNDESKATHITANTLPTSTNSTETCATTIVINTSSKPSLTRSNGTHSPSSVSMTTTKLASLADQRNMEERILSHPAATTGNYTPMNITITSASRKESLSGVPAGPTFKATGPKAVWMPGRSPQNTMETNQRKAHDQERFEERSGPTLPPQLRSVRLNVGEDVQNKNPKAKETHQKYFTPEETFAWKAPQNPQSSLPTVNSSTNQENDPSREKDLQNPFPLTNKSEPQTGNSSQLHYFQDPAGISYNKPMGHMPRGAIYIDHKLNSKEEEEELPKDAVLIDQKVIIEGDKIHTDSYYGIPTQEVTSTTVNIKAPSKYEFIGPLEKGIPVGLRTNVKKEHASDWYKSMFRSLHKSEEPNRDDFMTMRYRKRTGQTSHAGGYMSEPEFDRDDEYSHRSKYATLDYRRHPVREISLGSKSRTLPHATHQNNPYLPPPSPKASTEVYKNQPRSIAEYEPGHSSLAERETKLEEDSTPVQFASQYLSPQDKPKSLNYYTDGYESDSTLVRKMGKYPPLGTRQQRYWYRDFQQEASPKERCQEAFTTTFHVSLGTILTPSVVVPLQNHSQIHRSLNINEQHSGNILINKSSSLKPSVRNFGQPLHHSSPKSETVVSKRKGKQPCKQMLLKDRQTPQQSGVSEVVPSPQPPSRTSSRWNPVLIKWSKVKLSDRKNPWLLSGDKPLKPQSKEPASTKSSKSFFKSSVSFAKSTSANNSPSSLFRRTLSVASKKLKKQPKVTELQKSMNKALEASTIPEVYSSDVTSSEEMHIAHTDSGLTLEKETTNKECTDNEGKVLQIVLDKNKNSEISAACEVSDSRKELSTGITCNNRNNEGLYLGNENFDISKESRSTFSSDHTVSSQNDLGYSEKQSPISELDNSFSSIETGYHSLIEGGNKSPNQGQLISSLQLSWTDNENQVLGEESVAKKNVDDSSFIQQKNIPVKDKIDMSLTVKDGPFKPESSPCRPLDLICTSKVKELANKLDVFFSGEQGLKMQSQKNVSSMKQIYLVSDDDHKFLKTNSNLQATNSEFTCERDKVNKQMFPTINQKLQDINALSDFEKDGIDKQKLLDIDQNLETLNERPSSGKVKVEYELYKSDMDIHKIIPYSDCEEHDEERQDLPDTDHVKVKTELEFMNTDPNLQTTCTKYNSGKNKTDKQETFMENLMHKSQEKINLEKAKEARQQLNFVGSNTRAISFENNLKNEIHINLKGGGGIEILSPNHRTKSDILTLKSGLETNQNSLDLSHESGSPHDNSRTEGYQKYVCGIVKSFPKSEQFFKLKKFYTSIEHLAENGKSQFNTPSKIEINTKTTQIPKELARTKLTSYVPWKGKDDHILKFKKSSVENLKKLFDNHEKNNHYENNTGHFISPLMVAQKGKKIVRSNSVADLVAKYNSIDDLKRKGNIKYNHSDKEASTFLNPKVTECISNGNKYTTGSLWTKKENVSSSVCRWREQRITHWVLETSKVQKLESSGESKEKFKVSANADFYKIPSGFYSLGDSQTSEDITKRNDKSLTHADNSFGRVIKSTVFQEEKKSNNETKLVQDNKPKYCSSLEIFLTPQKIVTDRSKSPGPSEYSAPQSPRTCYSLSGSIDGELSSQGSHNDRQNDFFLLLHPPSSASGSQRPESQMSFQSETKGTSSSETESTTMSVKTDIYLETGIHNKKEFYEKSAFKDKEKAVQNSYHVPQVTNRIVSEKMKSFESTNFPTRQRISTVKEDSKIANPFRSRTIGLPISVSSHKLETKGGETLVNTIVANKKNNTSFHKNDTTVTAEIKKKEYNPPRRILSCCDIRESELGYERQTLSSKNQIPRDNYFLPHYIPERTVSEFDLSLSISGVEPFQRMHERICNISQSQDICNGGITQGEGGIQNQDINTTFAESTKTSKALLFGNHFINDKSYNSDNKSSRPGIVGSFYLKYVKTGDVKRVRQKFESTGNLHLLCGRKQLKTSNQRNLSRNNFFCSTSEISNLTAKKYEQIDNPNKQKKNKTNKQRKNDINDTFKETLYGVQWKPLSQSRQTEYGVKWTPSTALRKTEYGVYWHPTSSSRYCGRAGSVKKLCRKFESMDNIAVAGWASPDKSIIKDNHEKPFSLSNDKCHKSSPHIPISDEISNTKSNNKNQISTSLLSACTDNTSSLDVPILINNPVTSKLKTASKFKSTLSVVKDDYDSTDQNTSLPFHLCQSTPEISSTDINCSDVSSSSEMSCEPTKITELQKCKKGHSNTQGIVKAKVKFGEQIYLAHDSHNRVKHLLNKYEKRKALQNLINRFEKFHLFHYRTKNSEQNFGKNKKLDSQNQQQSEGNYSEAHSNCIPEKRVPSHSSMTDSPSELTNCNSHKLQEVGQLMIQPTLKKQYNILSHNHSTNSTAGASKLFGFSQEAQDLSFPKKGLPEPMRQTGSTNPNQAVNGMKSNGGSSACSQDSPHNSQNLVVGQASKPVKTTFEDDELKKHQEEERQRKLITELEMRRHTDNFMPSQKSPIPLDRYDNPYEPQATPPPKTPEVRNMAKVLYNFTAQTPRELSLNKGDIVYVTKEIDKNWYQGEHHGMIGIFPIKYVEIIPPENAHLQPRKATEGEARAKYNFRAQTSVELSVFKGETVILTGKVDQNWYEGRIGSKKGIVPSAYLEVLREPEEMRSVSVSPKSPRPPASPIHVPITNGTVSSRQTPNYQSDKNLYLEAQAASLPKLATSPTSRFSLEETKQPVMESLHINTFSEPIPYRALYSYKPQHEDELELNEGDTIYVMEKCDDGWYVGTSLRTGLFGTFPGNYVERI